MSVIGAVNQGAKGRTDSPFVEATSGYVSSLDGLRAIAILLVFGVHGQFAHMTGGSIGVDVFFVLSGYLITQLLVREMNEHGYVNLTTFYARRFVRLFPALLVVCACFGAYWQITVNTKYAVDNLIPSMTYIANYTRGRFQHPDAFGHLWSLSTEEQFYLVWPAIFLVLARIDGSFLWARRSLLGGVVVVMCWRIWLHHIDPNTTRIYDGIDSHSDGLMIGCALGLATQSAVRRIGMFWPLGTLGLLGWTAWGTWDNPALYWGGFTLIAICAATLIASTVTQHGSLHVRLLSKKPICAMGRLSYGAYLWHYPLIVLFQARFAFAPQKAILIGAPLSILAAAISYRFVEQPIRKARLSYSVSINRYLACAGPILLACGVLYAGALVFGVIS